MSSVNVRNCIRFYQTAEELNATTLMNYCGEIIASHWVSTFEQMVHVTCMHVLYDFFLKTFSFMYCETLTIVYSTF